MSVDAVLGTAGHIDHGKTALVRALTGVDTDRLAEEKRRGITIDLGFALLELDGARVGVVDVPGHEDFVRNMVAGASGIDLALLAVAADEGVMPQTREHVAILRYLGVPRAVIALTKVDLVDQDWLSLVRDDVAQLLASSPYEAAPLVPVSAQTGAGLASLRAELAEAVDRAVRRRVDDLFRMPVDRVFTVRGTGTVATGTVWSGRIEPGDEVQVLPAARRSRVRGLQRHGEPADVVGPGSRAAVALADLDRDELDRGDTLVTGTGWEPTRLVTARLDLLPDADLRLDLRRRVRVLLGTAEVMARVALLQDRPIEPGQAGWAQLRLEQPLVCRARDRFVLRSYSPVRTVGGGVVLEPRARRRRRRTTDSAALDAALESPALALALAVRQAGAQGLPRAETSVLIGATPAQLAELLGANGAPVEIEERLFDRDAVDAVRRRVVELVRGWHDRHPLRDAMPHAVVGRDAGAGLPAATLDFVLSQAVRGGELRAIGGGFALPDWRVRLGDDREAVLAELRRRLGSAGLEPLSAADIGAALPPGEDAEDWVAYLVALGEIVPFPGGAWIGAAALEHARTRVRRELGGRSDLSPGDFRELLGLSRRLLIPLLELFDAEGTTRRHGDVREVPAQEPAAERA